MENAKCKSRKVISRNNARKLGEKKPHKKMKKMKGKESIEPLIGTKHKCCQLTAQKPLKGLPIKDRRGVEGMFVKGLRTQYITRETLSEVNEARKNEDINKIIDIGRVYFQEGKHVALSKMRGGVSGCSDSRKPEESYFAFGEGSTDSDQDFESSLSPIRPPVSCPEEPNFGPAYNVRYRRACIANEETVSGKKLNSEEELHTFSIKYEARVGAQILFNLPENGVLEDALTALRKLQNQDEPQTEEPFPSCQPEFFKDDSETDPYTLQGRFSVPEEPFCETFMENPFENMFIMNPSEVENANHSWFLTKFDNDDETKRERVIEFQAREFEKPVKELEIQTPPIQFYRRNMF